MKLFKKYVAETLAVITVLVLSVLYGVLSGDQWMPLIFAFLTGVVAVLGAFAVYYWSHTLELRERIEQVGIELNTRNLELHAQIEVLRSVYLFLVDDERLMKKEADADNIWVMTPDLHYELDDPGWQDAIYKNVLRGAKL